MATVNEWLFALTLFTVLGCGLMAGVFFTFSVFLMKVLGRLPSSQGISTMQSINLLIVNPLFLTVFLGTAATSGIMLASALLRWQEPQAIYLLIGGALYLVGSFLVTIIVNIPKNNALAAVAPTAPDSANLWANYLIKWTAWNHVRTVTTLAATASLALALCH